MIFVAGASSTWMPFARAVSPRSEPSDSTRSGFHDAASAVPHGIVALRSGSGPPPLTPVGPSVITSGSSPIAGEARQRPRVLAAEEHDLLLEAQPLELRHATAPPRRPPAPPRVARVPSPRAGAGRRRTSPRRSGR